MKRNNNSTDVREWTTAKLKAEHSEMHSLIYGDNSCYGSQDIQMLGLVENELSERGVIINQSVTYN